MPAGLEEKDEIRTAGDLGILIGLQGDSVKVTVPMPKPADMQPALNVGLIEKGRAEAEKMGHTIVKLTPEERELWVQASAPIRDKWIAEHEAKGLPGKAIYEEAKRLISKYSK